MYSPYAWTVTGLYLPGSMPRFRLESPVVAWGVFDVVRIAPTDLFSFCAHFTRWSEFFASTSSDCLPSLYYPPNAVEQRPIVRVIRDMRMWQGKWMVLLEFSVIMTAEEINKHEYVRPAVLQYMSSSRPGGWQEHLKLMIDNSSSL